MLNMKKTCVAFLSAAFGAVAVSGQTCLQVDEDGAATFPANTLTIAKDAFYNCVKLKSVEIPNTVEIVGDYTFAGAINLASVTFAPDSVVTELGKYAFVNCVSLKSVEIPASVKIIGDYIFFGAVNLTSVTFAADSLIQSLGQFAFARTKIKNIVIPQGVTSFDGNSVFADTPCADKAVFQPGNTVVNCKIITAAPTTVAPTTAVPTKSVPPTLAPTTAAPTTVAPTTAVPTTMVPTTAAPTTAAPSTMVPTTLAPTTAGPTTMAPTEVKDTCANLKRKKCKDNCVFSKRQRQCLPKSTSLEHDCSQYEGKTPCLEVKVCKFPHGKCVHRCDGKNARRCRKHKFCNLDKVVNPCFGCHLVTACGPRR